MDFTRRELLIGLVCIILLCVIFLHYVVKFGPNFDETLNNFEIELALLENKLIANFEQVS